VALLAVVLLPLLGSLIAVLARRFSPTVVAWSVALPVASATVLLVLQRPQGPAWLVRYESWDWLPLLGLQFALRVDGLSWLFGMLILGIGLLILLYARYYMPADRSFPRLLALLSLFMTSMLGLVMSDNLLLLVVFWEATSVTSFLLIGFKTEDGEARDGARLALTVTATGGLALLGGVLLLGQIAGSFSLDAVLGSGDLIRASPLYRPALILVLLGAFTKSAQFPFHFWLPRAMAAPTPVSAYLHSATMVKAGVFLLARLYPVLSGTGDWTMIVGTVGAVTMLYGAYLAMWQHDLKGLLAYSTISHLGLITLLFGFATPMAVVAALFHVVNHAMFKASLFMAAGTIDHEVGTRDMRVLNGLYKYMPLTGTLAIVAAGAMAGVPLLNGFISKEMFFAEALNSSTLGVRWLEPAAATLAGALGVAYSLRFIMEVFFNDEGRAHPMTPHEPPVFMRMPGAILALACLAIGIAPAFIITAPLVPAVRSVLQAEGPAFDLALWHGVNAPLLMTLLALVVGVLLFRQREHLLAWHDRLPSLDMADRFGALLQRATQAAERVTRRMENGSQQRYVALLLGAALVVGAWPHLATPLAWTDSMTAPDVASATVGILLVLAVIGMVRTVETPLVALVNASVVGLLVSLAFARFASPDLALTQLLVELVTILLVLLALPHLPTMPRVQRSRTRALRDVLLASGAGVGTALLAWALLERPPVTMSGYYLQQALPQGGGRNVVNVILVDFRAFDTFGEVAVLGIAALGVVVVLQGWRTGPSAPHAQRDARAERHPLMLTVLAHALLPLALLMSAFVLLRGHDLPGGGFAAALLTAVALVVQSMAAASSAPVPRSRVALPRVIAIGLLVTAGTGAVSLLWGAPFLTSAYDSVVVPLVGKVPLSSALVFDVGVYATVVAAVLLMLERFAALTAAGEPAQDSGAQQVPDAPMPRAVPERSS